MVQAVDTLFLPRFLDAGGFTFVMDFAFHAECADVAVGTFNSQDTAEFIIHFTGYHHMVFDSRAENTLVMIGSVFLIQL